MATRVTKVLHFTKRDARDIRNIDEILSINRAWALQDTSLQNDLLALFRRWRVKLDKAGDKTKAFQRLSAKQERR